MAGSVPRRIGRSKVAWAACKGSPKAVSRPSGGQGEGHSLPRGGGEIVTAVKVGETAVMVH